MRQPFNYTAQSYVDDPRHNIPAMQPGKLFDRTDNDAHSAVPEGGPGVYGRVMVAGVGSNQASGSHTLGDRFYTRADTVSLPDTAGVHLTTPNGDTYDAAGIALPTDTNGDLIVAGVGIWTEYNKPHACQGRLEQPFGLGDKYYQEAVCGQVALCQEGNIWAYCETDIEKGDDLFYRTVVTSTTDGIQLLGAFRNDDDGGNAVPFNKGRVFVPGPAGGVFVLTLNSLK